MAELYQFLRYYLPGSLLLLYVLLFIIPNLSTDTLNIIGLDNLLAVFVGLLALNYAIGYLVYIPFNYRYEKIAMNPERRHALDYIARLAEEAECGSLLKCDTQKKEFLDLVYHSKFESSSGLKINPEIVATLKNHLSNYAARYVCGTYVPILLIPVMFFALFILKFAGIGFAMNNVWFSFFVLLLVLVVSLGLSMDRERVLTETFTLEEFMIRTKEKEVKELLRRLKLSRISDRQRRISEFLQ